MLRELADDVDAFDASLDKKGGMNISMADVSNKPEGYLPDTPLYSAHWSGGWQATLDVSPYPEGSIPSALL